MSAGQKGNIAVSKQPTKKQWQQQQKKKKVESPFVIEKTQSSSHLRVLCLCYNPLISPDELLSDWFLVT